MDRTDPADDAKAEPASPAPERFGGRVLYPHAYFWFIVLSVLDVFGTFVVLDYFGGQEINVIAAWVYHHWELPGMVAMKFATVAFVTCLCEIVGRLAAPTGRRLAWWVVAISAFPVVLAACQLIIATLAPEALT
jgi:hypothetical protein